MSSPTTAEELSQLVDRLGETREAFAQLLEARKDYLWGKSGRRDPELAGWADSTNSTADLRRIRALRETQQEYEVICRRLRAIHPLLMDCYAVWDVRWRRTHITSDVEYHFAKWQEKLRQVPPLTIDGWEGRPRAIDTPTELQAYLRQHLSLWLDAPEFESAAREALRNGCRWLSPHRPAGVMDCWSPDGADEPQLEFKLLKMIELAGSPVKGMHAAEPVALPAAPVTTAPGDSHELSHGIDIEQLWLAAVEFFHLSAGTTAITLVGRRNVVLAMLNQRDGLTPAALRDRWRSAGGVTGIAGGDKGARSVKQYITRGLQAVESLRKS